MNILCYYDWLQFFIRLVLFRSTFKRSRVFDLAHVDGAMKSEKIKISAYNVCSFKNDYINININALYEYYKKY